MLHRERHTQTQITRTHTYPARELWDMPAGEQLQGSGPFSDEGCWRGRSIAFCIMWFLTLAQATALAIDKFCGFVGQLVGMR